MQKLIELRTDLQAIMGNDQSRPFVCDGSPFASEVFIVGFNPATALPSSFWTYWSDERGFSKSSFMQDYLAHRPFAGVRPRVQAIVDELAPLGCLETNICSLPTKRAADLKTTDRRTQQFSYLFDKIRPKVVFAHSNEPIRFFERVTGVIGLGMKPTIVQWMNHSFIFVGSAGPLWRKSLADARAIGRDVRALVE